jgi:NIPSNAP
MKKLVLLFVICMAAFFLFAKNNFSQRPKAEKTTQVRIFTINKGKMNEFLSAWQKGVYPLRIKNGFKIEGAWVVQEKNKFIWILSYDGPDGFEAKDSAYYASQGRTTLKPDPVDYIADSEKYFIDSALPE